MKKEQQKMEKKSLKKTIRCHFCKKLGHIKVDCLSFVAWKKKKDAEGTGSKKEESADGKSSRVEEHPPDGEGRKRVPSSRTSWTTVQREGSV